MNRDSKEEVKEFAEKVSRLSFKEKMIIYKLIDDHLEEDRKAGVKELSISGKLN